MNLLNVFLVWLPNFSLNLFLLFWWLQLLLVKSHISKFHIHCISLHKLLYFSVSSSSFCTTYLSAGIAISISMHVFSCFVFNHYICPICCNFSVCVYCLVPQHTYNFLFIQWYVCVCVCVCVCACVHVCTIYLLFQCLGLCILSNANVHKLYHVSLNTLLCKNGTSWGQVVNSFFMLFT